MPIMQALSHTSRAYIWNADGLPGFINDVDIVKILKIADKRGELEQIKKWLLIDFDVFEE